MNKLFNKIATITLGLAMAIGVGAAIGGKGSGVRSVSAAGTDTLNRTFTGVSGTGYTSWSNKTGPSGAVYSGNSAGPASGTGGNSIQLKSNGSSSGIVTTTSGGKVSKFTVTWQGDTASGRTLDFYGKNSAYSSAADLYNNSKGTKLGSVVYGTSTVLTVSGDYTYVGIRSNSGAQYISSIVIEWASGEKAISYDANGGTGEKMGDTTISNGKATPSACTYTYVAKYFTGWNTNRDGTGDSYSAGTEYSFSDSTVLYAQWADATLTEITVKTPPTTTSYAVNDYFNPAGLVINLLYSNGAASGTATYGVDEGFTFNPDLNTQLTTNDTSVTITYGGESCSQTISVENVSKATFTAGTDKGSTSVIKNGITVSMSTMSRDDNYRTYSGTSMTVTSEQSITRIVVTCTGSGTSNYGPGKFSGSGYTYSGNTGTWAGNATSVSLAASDQVRMTLIEVYYIPNTPEVTGVTISGAAETITVEETQTIKALIDHTTETTGLNLTVNWTVSPLDAGSFSANTTAHNVNTVFTPAKVYDSVTITATSTDDNTKADSVTFSVTKVVTVASVSLDTTSGEYEFDANSDTIDVEFVSNVTYSSQDEGTNEVTIEVTPSTVTGGYVVGTRDAVTGVFNITFSKEDTYTIVATSVENPSVSSDSISVTITDIIVEGYEKISSISDVSTRGEYLIYIEGSTSNAVASTYNNSNYYNVGVLSAENNFISEGDATSASATIFKFEITTGGYLIKDASTEKYLAVTSDGNSIWHVSENDEDNSAVWTLNFSNDGSLTIRSLRYSNRDIEYNIQNSRISTYKSSYAASEKVYLYQKIDNSPYYTLSDVNLYVGVKGQKTVRAVPHNNPSATVSWSITSGNSHVRLESSGLNATISGLSESGSDNVILAATFTPNTYETLYCTIHVIEVDDYVNIGITKFEKVSSISGAQTWDGTYLIVDETNNKALDGSTTNIGNTVGVSINNESITATATTISQSFNIKKVDPNDSNSTLYTVKSNSNLYIGNHTIDNNLEFSYANEYVVSISNSGIITAVNSDGETLGSTTLYAYKSGENYAIKFYKNTQLSLALYKADGERRAITDTISDWYDNAKTNNYLVCNMSGEGSSINWSALSSGSYYTALTLTDKDTLKRMAAKSAEENGNYLEDFISDYDYLVSHKGYTDFLERFQVGGAMYGHGIYKPVTIIDSKKVNASLIVIVVSAISIAAVGGYFFLRKKKEQ